MAFLIVTIRTDEGESLGVLVLKSKAFSTGSKGFFGQTKIEIDGQRYQCQCQMVAIRDKGTEAAKP